MPQHSLAQQTTEPFYAWLRLAISLAVVTIGNIGMYSASVVLPIIQAEFGVDRGDASLPYAAVMVGFGLGGIFMGRISDRFGIFIPVFIGAIAISLGFYCASLAQDIWVFTLIYGLLIGLGGNSAMFAPIVADISLWFGRNRGIAVAICMSGNYLAGTIWPPLMNYFISDYGWRNTYMGIAAFCLLSIVPLSLCLRRRAPSVKLALRPASTSVASLYDGQQRPLGMSPKTLLFLLSLAGVGCCVAMAMPQVQIVAYCFDMGYGLDNGTNLLALMFATGVISRLAFGWLSDRIGGLRVLLLGSLLQALALVLYVFNHGLLSLYVISALFGLFQGGLVPAYAVIVREYFPAKNAGSQIGVVIMATMLGMALGGWMSGVIYDLSNSYQMAFLNGIAWNILNAGIVLFLLLRAGIGIWPRTFVRQSAF